MMSAASGGGRQNVLGKSDESEDAKIAQLLNIE
jgi:hypothetical protein